MKLSKIIPLSIFLLFFAACTPSTTKELISISTQEFFEMTKNKPEAVILDVRTLGEFNDGHIEGATQLDFYDPLFSDQLNELDKNKTYLIYCRSGSRSANTLEVMKGLGFQSVYDLNYGINDWEENNYPLA